MRFRLLFLLLAVVASQRCVRAQSPPSDNFRVYVLTMQPGDAVWEKFGHNALWVHDEAGQLDLAYNWGLFDFDDANFFRNFAVGLMRYSMGAGDLDRSIREYQVNNRTIWAQELDLSAEQKLTLVEFLARNELPENREYLYNYFNDNCSTRVRDAIDLATGGQLKPQLTDLKTAHTWRWHTRRLTQGSPIWYTALNTVIGPKADRPLSRWEECFIPRELHDGLADVVLTDEAGNRRSLVKEERILFQSTRLAEPDAPPNWIAVYGGIGSALGGLNLLLLRWAKRSRPGRVLFGTYVTLYAILIGLCGAIGLYFWFFTNHWGAHRNENLFAYSPLGLILAVVVPGLVRRAPGRARIAVLLSLSIAALTFIGLLLQLVPGVDQVNGEPLALVIPINLAAAWSLWRYWSDGRTRVGVDAPTTDNTAAA